MADGDTPASALERRTEALVFLRRLARSPLSDGGAASTRESLLHYHAAVSKWNADQLQRQMNSQKRSRSKRARSAARTSNREVRRPARYLHWTRGLPKDNEDGQRSCGVDDTAKSIRIGDEYQAEVLPPASELTVSLIDLPAGRSALTIRESDLCGHQLSSLQSCADREGGGVRNMM